MDAKRSSLERLLEEEYRRHPAATVDDLGKLLWQAVYGGDHWLADPDSFSRALMTEWKDLPHDDTASFPALQIIDPAGRTARLHLVAVRASGVRVESLCGFLLGQRRKCGRRGQWEALLRQVERMAQIGSLTLSTAQLERLRAASGPGHHSAGYGFAAYRVIHDLTCRRSRRWLCRQNLRP